MKNKSKEIVEKMLNAADIQINGPRPWDIKVHDERLYDRILAEGNLGLGESYMDGWWDSEALDETIFRAIRVGGEKLISRNLVTAIHVLRSKIFNLQSREASKETTEIHYDIGDDMYMAFLGPYSQYTCAYFKDTNDLKTAQERKMDLICRKIHLKPTDRVLDIGCGWGGMAQWMAEKHGCSVVGINLAKGQVKYAQEHIKDPKVKILNMDYRDVPERVEGKFDKVISIGMMEHVGYRNHRSLMEVAKRMLKPEGLFLLHHCGSDVSAPTSNAWITKYIFPGALIPSMPQITKAAEGLFVMEDWHNIGPHYDPTLMAWYKNFDAAWPRFKDQYGERFRRMFRYYLLGSAGSFRARSVELWQIVFSHDGIVGGYESAR